MAHRLFDNAKATRRIFRKVTVIASLALFCAAILLSVVNDMYAFFKPQESVRLLVSAPCTLSDFSELLGDNGVLLNPHVFSFYVQTKDKTALVENFTGELVLNTSMSYREILLALAEGTVASANSLP